MKHGTNTLHVTLPRRGGDLDNLLLKREAAWIFNLKTLAPFGLNVDFDLSCHSCDYCDFAIVNVCGLMWPNCIYDCTLSIYVFCMLF